MSTHLRTNALGDISVLYLGPLARAIRAHGATEQPLFRQFRMTPAQLAAPEARISIPRFMRIGEAAIRQTGNPALGLTMGRMTRPVDAGQSGLAAMTAPDAGTALSTLIRFSLLTSRNSRGHPQWDPDTGVASFYSIRPYNRFNLFVVDSVLAAWTQFLRDITDATAVLEHVWIEYPEPDYAGVFEQWFGCPVSFGAKCNAIQVRESVRPATSRHAQPAIHRQLVQECEAMLAKIRSGWSMTERVREQLMPLLNGQAPDIATVASQLGMGPWTLRRELAAEKTRFRDLMDTVRRDLARDYVSETRLKFSEIAWVLGFSGPPAFHKAFRRWFGVSAGDFRRNEGE